MVTEHFDDQLGESKSDFIAEAHSFTEGMMERHIKPEIEAKTQTKAIIVVVVDNSVKEPGRKGQIMAAAAGSFEVSVEAAKALLTHPIIGRHFKKALFEIMAEGVINPKDK